MEEAAAIVVTEKSDAAGGTEEPLQMFGHAEECGFEVGGFAGKQVIEDEEIERRRRDSSWIVRSGNRRV